MSSLGRTGTTRAHIYMETCIHCGNIYAASKGRVARRTPTCGDKPCVAKANARSGGRFEAFIPKDNFEMKQAGRNPDLRRWGQPKIFNSPFRKSDNG